MSAKGLFAETLSGVGPDPNAPVQQKNTQFVEPVSSMVSTWRGSGEHVVIHVEQPELSSLVSTQRGSGAYASVTSVDYHTAVLAGQTLPLGTRVDPNLSLDQTTTSMPPATPRLSSVPLDTTAIVPLTRTAANGLPQSLLPNTLSIPTALPKRSSLKFGRVAALAFVSCLGASLLVPTASHPEATFVPALSITPLAARALHTGLVGKVHVNVGDTVAPGQVLVSLDENERARHAERLRLRIDQLENELEQLVSTDQRLHSAALGALRKKRALLVDRLAHHTARTEAGAPNLQARTSSRAQVTPVSDSAAEKQADTQLHLQQQLAEVDFLRNDRQRSFEQRKRSTEAALSEAHAELLQVNSIELTTRASVSSRVGRVLVEPGQSVSAGTALVELTPLDAPAKLVGYLTSDTVARIDAQQPAQVNLSHFTRVSEARALFESRLTYVANAPSPPEEVQAVTGFIPSEPMRRVELEWPQEVDTTGVGALAAGGGPLPRITATFASPDEVLAVHLIRSAKRALQGP